MTENIDSENEQYLYEIVQLENAINAAGWTIIRIGLLERYLCHAATGKIVYKVYSEPHDDQSDLLNLIMEIQESHWLMTK
jgi:hypothetical protein